MGKISLLELEEEEDEEESMSLSRIFSSGEIKVSSSKSISDQES